MKDIIKVELKKAYEAGVKSVEQNKERDEKLENGVKQIEAEYNFENWYLMQSLNEEQSNELLMDVFKGKFNKP